MLPVGDKVKPDGHDHCLITVLLGGIGEVVSMLRTWKCTIRPRKDLILPTLYHILYQIRSKVYETFPLVRISLPGRESILI
jgi:hypothetical protein